MLLKGHFMPSVELAVGGAAEARRLNSESIISLCSLNLTERGLKIRPSVSAVSV